MTEKEKDIGKRAGTMLIMLAALVLVVAGLKAAQNFFLPVLLAFFVSTASYPIMRMLTQRRIPRWMAVLVTVLVDFSFIAGVAVLGMVLVQDLQTKWNAKYAGQLSQQLRAGSENLADQLEQMGVVDASEKIQDVVENNLQNLQDIRFEKIWDFGTGVLGQLVGFFGAALIFLILTVFMLSEADSIGKRLRGIHVARGPDFTKMLESGRDIQRYLAIKTLASLVTGLLAGILCRIAGLDFFLLWGILAFALNFIPVIGSIVAGVPPVILALLAGGVSEALVVAIGYLMINNVIGGLVEPVLVGRRLKLSTLVVIVSVLFWGWVWGPLGMLLAVPLTMLVKVMLHGSPEFRWVSVAISNESAATLDVEETLPSGSPPA